MIRLFALTLVFGMTVISAAVSTATLGIVANEAVNEAADEGEGASEARTMTGWFSDAQCAAPRVAKGIIAPNNPDCVRKCLKDGHTPVFISEQAKALFEVRDHASVAADVGFHVEVVGTIDESGKILSVTSVKRLEEQAPTCALPKKSKTK